MATAQDLQNAIPALSASDQQFANSLLANIGRMGGASTKMQIWVDKLVERAATGAPDRVTAQVGNMNGVLSLFEKAAKHLKRPAVVINLGGTLVRLTRATARAQVPGSVNVVEVPADGSNAAWYGRVLTNGTFEASRKFDTPAGLVPALVELAADPAKVATAHGRLTGRCCFCDIPLKDERSTAVGYGKTCASHWGLEWGKQRTEFSCDAVAA